MVNYSQPVSEEWHSHEALHLSLILQGGNRESRKKEDIEVSTGKIIVYREGILHCNKHTEYPSKNLNIELKTPFLEAYQLNNDIFEPAFIEHTDFFLDTLNLYYELIIKDIYSPLCCSRISYDTFYQRKHFILLPRLDESAQRIDQGSLE